MQQVFEFGEYWDINTFILVMMIGVAICCLNYLGTERTKRECFAIEFGINPNRLYNRWYCILFLMLLFFYTFRSIRYGADTGTYVTAFRMSTDIHNELISQFEPLFVLFNYVVRGITDNYTLFFCFSGMIMSYGYVRFIRTFWDGEVESLFLILISMAVFYDMNILRSGMGGAFVLISLCNLKEGYFKKAFVYSIIAILFQYTLVVHLLFLLFYKIIMGRKTKLIDIPRKKMISYVIAAFFLVIVASYSMKIIFANTRYAYYFTAFTPTILGNWPIIASGILGFIALDRFSESTDVKFEIASIVSIYNLILIPPTIIIGAYRVTQYHFSIRLVLWGWIFKDLIKKDLKNVLLRKIIVIVLILFYAIFYMGRRSLNPGFAYELVELF